MPLDSVTTVTGDYNALPTDTVIQCNAAAGVSITITLPTAVGISGKPYVIVKINASTFDSVTVQVAGGVQTISGSTTQVLTAQWTAMRVESTAR